MKNINELKAILTADYREAQTQVCFYHHKMHEATKQGDEAEYKACERMKNEGLGARDYIRDLSRKLGVFDINFQEICDQVNEKFEAEYGYEY